MDQTTQKTIVSMLALLLLTTIIFLGTVELRRSWVTLSDDKSADYETYSLIGAKNWYREGFLTYWGAMLKKPKSIETDTIQSRDLYCSVPPGALLELYLLGKIVGQEPSLSLQWEAALAHHLLIALVLTLMAFVFLRQIGYGHRDSFLFACVPMLLELCTPLPLRVYRVGMYFYEGPVLLPFTLYVFLEILRDSARESKQWRRVLSFLQSLVAFWGIMIEWIFAFIVTCVYIKRVVRGEMGRTVFSFLGKSILFGFSFALGVFLFVLQIYHWGVLTDLYDKFQLKSGQTSEVPFIMQMAIFFGGHLRQGYGIVGLILLGCGALCAALIALYVGCRLLKGKKPHTATTRTLSLIYMLLVPCLIYVVVFRWHVVNPFYSFCSWKFSIPFALVPLVLTPLLIVSLKQRQETPGEPYSRAWSLLPLTMILASIGYIALETPASLSMIAHENLNPEIIVAAEFVEANTGYEDIVFTQDFSWAEIASNRYLAYSMKEVYKVRSAQDIFDKVNGIEGDYIINILSRGEDSIPPYSFLRDFIARAYESRVAEGLRLDKIRKTDFLALCNELGISEATPDPQAKP